MKRLLIIPALFTAASCFAQTQCSTGNPLFSFTNTESPRTITKLGTSPEFPFLRNMTSAAQVAAAISRNDKKSTTGMEHLNDMLMNIGFANGAKDVTASNISMYYVPVGTEGNMGSGGYTNVYAKLEGDASEFKAWKITSGTGCHMYIMAKCGNAFFPKTEGRTACLSVPVTINSDVKEVTLNSSGQKITTTDNVYVYYHRKRHKKSDTKRPVAAINDDYPSDPLLLNTASNVETVPETYRVTLNPSTNTVNVCPDSTLALTANISVEKTAEYAGNYPKSKTEYRQVSKRHYKKSARKMRKIERKERRVTKLTGVAPSRCVAAK